MKEAAANPTLQAAKGSGGGSISGSGEEVFRKPREGGDVEDRS